uniref:Uncharacterized protein n=1 Tax=Panagrolaimus sp. PS1159 TaxID=55785 RepID=A0AC35GRX0_9BILA
MSFFLFDDTKLNVRKNNKRLQLLYDPYESTRTTTTPPSEPCSDVVLTIPLMLLIMAAVAIIFAVVFYLLGRKSNDLRSFGAIN